MTNEWVRSRMEAQKERREETLIERPAAWIEGRGPGVQAESEGKNRRDDSGGKKTLHANQCSTRAESRGWVPLTPARSSRTWRPDYSFRELVR